LAKGFELEENGSEERGRKGEKNQMQTSRAEGGLKGQGHEKGEKFLGKLRLKFVRAQGEIVNI